jgi:type II secretory pathway component PulM
MMSWFQSREPRERVLLLIIGALLALYVAWFLINREAGPTGQSKLEAAQTDRELWLRAAPKLSVSGASGERAAFTRGALIDVARKRGVELSRIQPQPNGGLTVYVEDVGTPEFYAVIGDLVAGYNVDVENVLISTTPNGVLNAQFTLAEVG